MTPVIQIITPFLPERAELNARASADQAHLQLTVERQPLSLEERIAAALDALDGLSDAADAACRFSLRAIAGNAYAALDGYAREREAV